MSRQGHVLRRYRAADSADSMSREGHVVRRYAIATEATRAGISAVQFLASARLLGSAEYGIYAQVIALAIILTPISTFAAASWLQPALAQGERGAQECVTALNTSAVLLGLPLALASAALIGGADWERVGPLILISIAEVAGFASWNAVCLVDLGLREPRAYLVGTMWCGTSKMLATLLCFALGGDALTALGGSLLLVSIIGYVVHVKSRGYRLIISVKGLAHHWAAATQRGAVSLVSAVFDQADRVVVGFLVPAADLSSYAAAGRIANYSLIPSRGVALAAYPHYFELCDMGATRHAMRLAGLSSLRGVILGLPVALAAICGTWLLENTLLDDFSGLTYLVIILSAFAILRPVHYAFGDLLYALGRPFERLAALLSLSIVYIGGVFLVAPKWGVISVAIYSVASEVVLIIVLIALVLRAVPLRRA
jgi:O-antigen/teichoic acid export membrane protein